MEAVQGDIKQIMELFKKFQYQWIWWYNCSWLLSCDSVMVLWCRTVVPETLTDSSEPGAASVLFLPTFGALGFSPTCSPFFALAADFPFCRLEAAPTQEGGGNPPLSKSISSTTSKRRIKERWKLKSALSKGMRKEWNKWKPLHSWTYPSDLRNSLGDFPNFISWNSSNCWQTIINTISLIKSYHPFLPELLPWGRCYRRLETCPSTRSIQFEVFEQFRGSHFQLGSRQSKPGSRAFVAQSLSLSAQSIVNILGYSPSSRSY